MVETNGTSPRNAIAAAPTRPPSSEDLTTLGDQLFRRRRVRRFQFIWDSCARLGSALRLPVAALVGAVVDKRERRAGAHGRLLHLSAGLGTGTGRSLAIYAHFSPTGRVSEMVLAQLREYARLGFRLIFVTSSPVLSLADRNAVSAVAEIVIHRRNFGFDFGAWADAAILTSQASDTLDELLLVNDSVLGPLAPLDTPLARIRTGGDGLFGLTEGVQHSPHLQSYFLLARGTLAIADLLEFLGNAPLSSSKRLTIRRCEIGVSAWMRARGHRLAAVWGYAAMERSLVESDISVAALVAAVPNLERHSPSAEPGGKQALRRSLLDVPLNPTHHMAALLVQKCGFPFLKTELVLRNPTRMPDVVTWQELIPSDSVVPLRLIDAHLTQMQQPRLVRGGVRSERRGEPDATGVEKDQERRRRDVLAAAWQRSSSTPAKAPRVGRLGAATILRRCSRTPLVLSFSHDDYAEHCGGVQNVIAAEQRRFESEGIGYLHLAPASPRQGFASSDDGVSFLVRLDGEALGVAELSELVHVCHKLGAQGAVYAAIVHHLSGHAPEHVLTLLKAAEVQRKLLWLHDFGVLCQNPALLRNDLVFCGAPRVGSGACGICVYGRARAEHLARMESFLAAAKPHLLAPSRRALEFWNEHRLRDDLQITVVPPARLIATPMTKPPPLRRGPRPLRIAHLGSPHFQKGWDIFTHLVERFADDPRYQFLHLGVSEDTPLPPGIRFVPVRVNSEAPLAMVNAVADEEVDVVVNWSRCHETFSFVAHEAIAGGAIIVARRDAGNVGNVITENAPQRGILLGDEQELRSLFESNRLYEVVDSAPPGRWRLLPGSGTAEWLVAQGVGPERSEVKHYA